MTCDFKVISMVCFCTVVQHGQHVPKQDHAQSEQMGHELVYESLRLSSVLGRGLVWQPPALPLQPVWAAGAQRATWAACGKPQGDTPTTAGVMVGKTERLWREAAEKRRLMEAVEMYGALPVMDGEISFAGTLQTGCEQSMRAFVKDRKEDAAVIEKCLSSSG